MNLPDWIKDAAKGSGLCVVSFLVLEGALRLFSSGPELDPIQTRGFDPSAQYFLDTIEDGQTRWRPVYWDANKPSEGTISEKSDKIRVLMFGGSNTKNFGSASLAVGLSNLVNEDENGEPKFEIINLARNGFGSSRVRIVFEQALNFLNPDIVFIYSGHNEFVELGFQMDLDSQWSNPVMRTVAGAVVASSTFAVFRDALDLQESGKSSGAPREWKWEYDKFNALTFTDTEKYLEAYRANLDDMLGMAEGMGVKAVLSTVVYNRFAMPSSSVLPTEMSEVQKARALEINAGLYAHLPEWVQPLFPGHGRARVENFDWDLALRKARDAGEGGPDYYKPKDELWFSPFATGKLEGADPLIPSPKYWTTPKVRQLVQAMDHLHRRKPTDEDKSEFGDTLKAVDELLTLCPDHPRGLFFRAVANYYLGADIEGVRQDFEDAGKYDRAPRRGNSKINGIVREVAADHPDSLFVDSDLYLSENHETGLIGWKWMMDQCHLGHGGRRYVIHFLAQNIIDEWYGEAQ